MVGQYNIEHSESNFSHATTQRRNARLFAAPLRRRVRKFPSLKGQQKAITLAVLRIDTVWSAA